MTLPTSIVATPATRNLARQIIADTTWDGAEGTLRNLGQVRPSQLPALVHLLAVAATTGEVPGGAAGRDRKALLLTADERRRAHNRFNAGHRDPATRRGESEYQRARKRGHQTPAAATSTPAAAGHHTPSTTNQSGDTAA